MTGVRVHAGAAGVLSCPACGFVAGVAGVSCGFVGAPWLCPPAPPVARSRLSESSRNTPAATIRSPSLSPLRISTRSASCTTERHGSRFESIAGGDEHVLLEPGVHDCVARHGDHDLSRRFKDRRSIQARSEAAARIGRREADAQRARAVGERRIDEVHTCRERLAP